MKKSQVNEIRLRIYKLPGFKKKENQGNAMK